MIFPWEPSDRHSDAASHDSCHQPPCRSCNPWSSLGSASAPSQATSSHLHPSRMPITHLPAPDKASQSLLVACSISQSISLLWVSPRTASCGVAVHPLMFPFSHAFLCMFVFWTFCNSGLLAPRDTTYLTSVAFPLSQELSILSVMISHFQTSPHLISWLPRWCSGK